jgi:hypothetical protein
MLTDLNAEVEKLRVWLQAGGTVDSYEAWWSELGVVDALQRLVGSVQPEQWTETDVSDLLFVLDHSHTEYPAELVMQDEAAALAIGKHALARGAAASDDIADQLGNCTFRKDEAEALLVEFARDEHERTRRMALLSLAKLGSDAVPALAVEAWNSGIERQRIGALSALKTIGSDLLPAYIAEAEKDGRERLLAYARTCALDTPGDAVGVSIPAVS